MTIKQMILATVIWTLLMFGVGMIGVWYIMEHPIRGVRTEERSGRLGTGIGLATTIGYAAVWLPYAAKVGKKRRLEREQRSCKKSKRGRSQ